MTSSDLAQQIQNIVNQNVSGHMAMAVYVVSPSLSLAGQFFSPSIDNFTIWNANHEAVSASDIPELQFEIASISKVFASRIFYQLQGSYDGTIGTCAPNLALPAAISQLPISSIGAYCSGLPQDNGSPPDPRGVFCPVTAQQSLQTLVDWFASPDYENKSTWICNPGACYSYSNLAWNLLAIAGLSPADTSVDVASLYNTQLGKLCGTLNMPNTQLFSQSLVGSNMACGYANGQPLPVNGKGYGIPPMIFGSGGIVSCASDMLQWLLYNMGQLSASSSDFGLLMAEQTATAPQPKCGYTGKCGTHEQDGPMTAFGWMLPTVGGGSAGSVLAKDGGLLGFTSWMGFEQWSSLESPSQNGVVVLKTGQNASQIGQSIMALLVGASDVGPLPSGDVVA